MFLLSVQPPAERSDENISSSYITILPTSPEAYDDVHVNPSSLVPTQNLASMYLTMSTDREGSASTLDRPEGYDDVLLTPQLRVNPSKARATYVNAPRTQGASPVYANQPLLAINYVNAPRQQQPRPTYVNQDLTGSDVIVAREQSASPSYDNQASATVNAPRPQGVSLGHNNPPHSYQPMVRNDEENVYHTLNTDAT